MRIRVVGTGAYVPSLRVSNTRLVKAIPGPNKRPWTAGEITQKTGIQERRFFFDFDDVTGKRINPPGFGSPPGPNGLMAEHALMEALQVAGMKAGELDGLIIATCTPDRLNFSQDALLIHQRLGMKKSAFVEVKDTGCGGALFNLNMARMLIASGECKSVAVIGVHVTSAYLDRDVYTSDIMVNGRPLGAFLTMYLFGDGAGAIILRADSGTKSGICASFAENEYLDLVLRPGGGTIHPPGTALALPRDHGCYVNGPLVKSSFAPVMQTAVESVLHATGKGVNDISRFFLHQANKLLVEAFATSVGIPLSKLSMHMERYGNTSAAGTLILLAEDVRNGVATLGSGEPILMSALGAGAQVAAHVIEL